MYYSTTVPRFNNSAIMGKVVIQQQLAMARPDRSRRESRHYGLVLDGVAETGEKNTSTTEGEDRRRSLKTAGHFHRGRAETPVALNGSSSSSSSSSSSQLSYRYYCSERT